MQVKDVMTEKVTTLKSGDSVSKALKVFSKNGISGAPVVRRQKVVGVLSQADIVRFVDYHSPKIYYKSSKLFPMVLSLLGGEDDFESTKKALKELKNLKVKDVMTKDVLTVDHDEDILVAANRMDSNHVNRLPVLKNGKLNGIITRADIIKALAFD